MAQTLPYILIRAESTERAVDVKVGGTRTRWAGVVERGMAVVVVKRECRSGQSGWVAFGHESRHAAPEPLPRARRRSAAPCARPLRFSTSPTPPSPTSSGFSSRLEWRGR